MLNTHTDFEESPFHIEYYNLFFSFCADKITCLLMLQSRVSDLTCWKGNIRCRTFAIQGEAGEQKCEATDTFGRKQGAWRNTA